MAALSPCEHCGNEHSPGEYVCPETNEDRVRYLIEGLQNEDPVADIYFLIRYGGPRHEKFRTQDIFYRAFISALEAEIAEEAEILGPEAVQLVRGGEIQECLRRFVCAIQPDAYFRFRCRHPERSLRWIVLQRLPECLSRHWRKREPSS